MIGNSVCLVLDTMVQRQSTSITNAAHVTLFSVSSLTVYVHALLRIHCSFQLKNNAHHKHEESGRERESNDSVRIIQRYLNRIDIRHFRTLSGIAWRKEGKKKESMPASIHTQLVLEIYFAR